MTGRNPLRIRRLTDLAGLIGPALVIAAIIAAALSLSGCTVALPRPEAVPTPVAIPCLPAELPEAPPVTPVGAFSVMTRGEIAAILAEEWLAYSAWIKRAKPYLDACREAGK